MYLYDRNHLISRTKKLAKLAKNIGKVRRKKEKLKNLVFQVIAIAAVTQKCSMKKVFSKIS